MDRSTAVSSLHGTRFPVLINRDFTLLAAGQTISSLGDAIFNTTVILWIATGLARGAGWAPAAVAVLVLIEEVPQVVVGPLAGVFVDRWEKKRTMLLMDGARAALLSLLILVVGLSVVSLPGLAHLSRYATLGTIYVTMLLVTLCSQFFGPSRFALIGDIVPDEKRALASSLGQSNAAISAILGPALAAPLFFGLGAGWSLGIDALSFLVSFLAILLVRVPATPGNSATEPASSVQDEFLEGIRLVCANRVLRTLLVTGFVIMLGFGALNALTIFFLQQNLHASSHLFGLLGAAQGVGVLVGAITAGIYAERMGVERLMWIASLLFGSLILIYSRLTSFPPALMLTVLMGLAFAALEVAEAPLILRATPRAFVGRVSTILVPAYATGATLSALVAGWLVSTVLRHLHTSFLGISLGPYDGVFSFAGFLVIGAGLYAMLNLRRTAIVLETKNG